MNALSDDQLTDKQVKHLLEQLSKPNVLPQSNWQLKPINRGLNNKVWLISNADNSQQLICRISKCNKRQTLNGRKGLSLQQQLSDTGISANIYHQCQIDDFNLTLMEYIQGSQKMANIWSEQQRKVFAKQLAKLHQSQINIPLEELDICAHLNHYLLQLKDRLKPQQFNTYQLAVEKVCGLLTTFDIKQKAIGQRGICHNDLNRLNIVYSDNKHQFILLDWDEARIGDCFFDLAGFTVEHQLTQEQSHRWLEYYFIALSPTQNAPASIEKIAKKLVIYQQAYRLVCELWHRLYQDEY